MSARGASPGPVLALDLGSTSFKAGVFDRRLRLLGMAAAPVAHVYGRAGEVELEVAVVERALRLAIRGALRAAGLRAERLAAVAVTSQAQTFTVAAGAGAPRMNFISWQDMRAGAACARLARDPALRDFARHASFGELLPPLLICLLAHLRRERPGFVRPADRVLLLPAFVMRQLTGRSVVDANLAAMSGLYSMVEGGWWGPALRAAGVSAAQLPEVVPIGAAGAMTRPGAARFGLAPGVPVVLAGNDQTAGAYGARIEGDGALLVTLGTAHVAYRWCGRAPAPARGVIRGPYPGGGFYRMAADLCGGNLVNWARGVLAGCDTDPQFYGAAARAEPGCRGLRFGIRLPAPGCWEGVGLHHGPGDFARSVLEALAARLVELVGTLGGAAGLARVLAAGGGSRQPLWRRLLAERLGAPVRAVRADPLAGAARMAVGAVGHQTPCLGKPCAIE